MAALRNMLILALMLASAGLALFLRPGVAPAGAQAEFQLKTMIPASFGDWRGLPDSGGQVVNPQLEESLGNIYSQVLARTYVNGAGERIMLSIAYGSRQDTKFTAHRPEVCYAVAGFSVRSQGDIELSTPAGRVAAQRLIAKLGGRSEPITYWVRIGDELTTGWISQKMAMLKYGLGGQVEDGLLFRVSSISRDPAAAYAVQDRFVTELLAATAPQDRQFLVGRPPDLR